MMLVLVFQSMTCVNISKHVDISHSSLIPTAYPSSEVKDQGSNNAYGLSIKSPLNLKDPNPNNMQCIFTFLNTIKYFFLPV